MKDGATGNEMIWFGVVPGVRTQLVRTRANPNEVGGWVRSAQYSSISIE